MMNKFYSFVIVVFFSFLSLHSEEMSNSYVVESSIPDLRNLSNNWWEYFNKTGPEFDEHAKAFIEYLDELEKDPQSKQNNNQSTITVIKRLLHGMMRPKEKSKDLPLFPVIEKQNTYTVRTFVDLKANLEATRKILKENKSLLTEESRRHDELLTILDQYVEKYPKIPKDSPSKLKTGLTIVLYQLTCKVSENTMKQCDASIDQSNDVIDILKRIIDDAAHKLTSSPQEIRELETQSENAKKEWLQAKDELYQKKLYQTSDQTESSTSQSVQMLFNQELCSLSVQEAFKRMKYEFLDLSLALSEYVHAKNVLDINALQDKLRLIYEDISLVLERSQEWLEASQSALIASSGSLFLLTDNSVDLQSGSQELVENNKKIVAISEKTITQLEEVNQLLIGIKFLNDFLFNEIVTESGFFQNYAVRIQFMLHELYDDLTYYYDITLFHIGTKPVTLRELTQAFIVFILAYILAKFLRKVSNRILRRNSQANVHIVYRIDRTIQYVILTAGFLIALSIIGFDLTNLAIVIGALGVGLGFGLQNVFNNFICGLIILFENQIKVGDFVQLATGLEGQITEIKSHSTFIRNSDGVEIIVPNSDLINGRLINWTLGDVYRRTHIPFAVSYDSDLAKVKKIVLDIANINPSTVSKDSLSKPELWLINFGTYGIDFELVVWTNVKETEQEKSCISSYLWEIEKMFREEKIDIPCVVKELCIMSERANRETK